MSSPLDDIVTAYNEAVFDTDRDRALKVIESAIQDGLTAEEVVFGVVIPAIESMVKSISEDFDANLAQHFMASQIAAEVTETMVARFATAPQIAGRVVIGTSQGDLHSLGKRIVSGCLKSFMIEVTDLGVNVDPDRFVEEAVARDAQVIAISSMMVHTARGENGCRRVRQILQERDLESRIQVIVGGAPYRFDPDLYRIVGADLWAEDGVTAGKVILDLVRAAQR
jgi:trimethylamine corrinoid protein